MKKFVTGRFILAAFAILFYSCKEEDPAIDDQLNGQWNLIDVTCECSPAELNYGEHVWSFDLTNNIVTVQNAVKKPLQILESGDYEFELTDSTIKIKTVTYDYYFEEGKLFLADKPEVDGPLMEFVR